MRHKIFYGTHLVILGLLVVLGWNTYTDAHQKDGLLRIYFLNVGQGDAIFIQAPNGNQVLIDGGPDSAVLSQLENVLPLYDRDLDMVIATHPDHDHIGGLFGVLEHYTVGTIVESLLLRDTGEFKRWQTVVTSEEAEVVEGIAGRKIDLGNEVTLTVLYPIESLQDQLIKKANNYSVVTMLHYRDLEVLLTGDIEALTERALLSSGILLDADVLKVPHHGSKTSSTLEFLQEVTPDAVVMQVGKGNTYGHPHPDVLKRLENLGIKQYRTDVDGRVELVSDGSHYTIRTEY